MKKLLILFLISFAGSAYSQSRYWNTNTQLVPWRFPIVPASLTYEDLDNDGDPDVLKGYILDSIPFLWIDDDDDMKKGDREGDIDSDCLLIDRNKDGIFAGPWDLSLDWGDENRDGRADIQLLVSNGGEKFKQYFDWDGDFMYVMDEDGDNILHHINWNKIRMEGWEHHGAADFFEDYHGNSLFLKMHGSSFRIHDLQNNWENPFIFYDEDGDGLTERAIRLVNTPDFRKSPSDPAFAGIDPRYEIKFNQMIDYVGVTWDMDNDNGPGNEFDFDLSLLQRGKGFSYAKDLHRFKSMNGLKEADKYFYDPRWRHLTDLYYPDRVVTPKRILTGEWNEYRMVFDEDDDCARWERVEFYDPKDIFLTGRQKGGLDHNNQADAAGDRCDFDLDGSGKGKMYVSPMDGKIHLFGAEWGVWRVDQTGFFHQGFGGLYDRWRPERQQQQPTVFPTILYVDQNANGFADLVKYDLDGDRLFEDSVSLTALGIADTAQLIDPRTQNQKQIEALFSSLANKVWNAAQQAVQIAESQGINSGWYNYYKTPRSIQERYSHGFWLGFYLYRDLRQVWKEQGRGSLVTALDKAYYSGNWNILKALLNKK